MSKQTPKGIRTLPDAVRTGIGQLNSDTAFIVQATYATQLTRDFLCKTIRRQLAYEFGNSDDFVLIGYCRGDMTIGEISSILSTQLPDPEDFQSWDEIAQVNGIFWETLHLFQGAGDTTFGSNAIALNDAVSLGGGKGIPLEAGHGIQMFAFNPSAAQLQNTSGAITGTHQLVGVWMEGSN